MADNKLWQQIRAIEDQDLPYAKAADKLYELFINELIGIKQRIIELRNDAHVNCLEEQKQAFNAVINLFETLPVSKQLEVFSGDIDTVGKCANCGVEFHIHKLQNKISHESRKEETI